MDREQSDQNRERFTALLGQQFHYFLSDADLARIQTLVNELRDEISRSTKLAEDHRKRLLSRLERLQRELHKRISDLDRFYGSNRRRRGVDAEIRRGRKAACGSNPRNRSDSMAFPSGCRTITIEFRTRFPDTRGLGLVRSIVRHPITDD